MSRERLDYGIERQRHKGFVGRDAVLATLDRLLLDEATDRWVVVTGGPGMGKSAILAAWLSRREATGAVVPHHFIRRGFYGWDEPATIVRSLAAQVEACYPTQCDPEARPESRLVDLLSRVSARELAPRGEHLVLLVDGLDEYDSPKGARGDPLAAFLPHALPPGVRLLCASRPRHPYLDALEARHGVLTRLDLDHPAAADDNDVTVRAFWHRQAVALGLNDMFVQEAVARAGGNLQHAATLQKHLAVPSQKRLDFRRRSHT